MTTETKNSAGIGTDEAGIPITKVGRYIGQTFNVPSVHTSTVLRWTVRGVRGIVLKSFPIGGRRYIRPNDLRVFMEQVAAAA